MYGSGIWNKTRTHQTNCVICLAWQHHGIGNALLSHCTLTYLPYLPYLLTLITFLPSVSQSVRMDGWMDGCSSCTFLTNGFLIQSVCTNFIHILCMYCILLLFMVKLLSLSSSALSFSVCIYICPCANALTLIHTQQKDVSHRENSEVKLTFLEFKTT